MEDFEVLVEKNTKRNEKFLKEFAKWLDEKGLTEKTKRKHFSNVDFYINDFLNYYDVYKMEDGIFEIDDFLGDWFIRKCLWSSRNSIKETAASIKKFYQCMMEFKHIEEDDYKKLCDVIKNNMEIWLDTMDDYDSEDFADFL